MARRKVRDVMTVDVACAREDTPFKDLAGILAGRGVSALPVLDAEDRVSGVVSEVDLLRKEEFKEDPSAKRLARWRYRGGRARAAGVTARQVMSSPAVTIGPDASVVEAARALDRNHVKRLPVVDAGQHVAGIVSPRDLLRVFLRSDEEIASEVQAEVFEDWLKVSVALVKVEVEDGVVTLRGEVERKSMIAPAVRLTRSVDGVVDVVDKLTFAIDDTHLPRVPDLTDY